MVAEVSDHIQPNRMVRERSCVPEVRSSTPKLLGANIVGSSTEVQPIEQCTWDNLKVLWMVSHYNRTEDEHRYRREICVSCEMR